MSEPDAYAPGTPSWVDLGSPDPEASARFYEGLFGWEAVETGTIEETGGYRMFMLGGRHVAGLGPLQGEGQPPMWTTYVSVEDAAATAAKVAEAGGQAMLEPMDVLTAGRMAVFLDSEGAAFAVWQPGDHKGAAVVNEPGSLCWNELATRDLEGARTFYGEVFGWTPETSQMEGTDYTLWLLDGKNVGGATEMSDQWPEDIPPHWSVSFAVDDTDEAAEKAGSLGGKVSIAPTDISIGRFAVLNGPHGEVFSVIKLAQQPPES
ncbi:VOC family protein [soil metagenome]